MYRRLKFWILVKKSREMINGVIQLLQLMDANLLGWGVNYSRTSSPEAPQHNTLDDVIQSKLLGCTFTVVFFIFLISKNSSEYLRFISCVAWWSTF